MSDYTTMANRVRHATTHHELLKLETSIDRIYDAGRLSIVELRRLNNLIFDQLIKLDSQASDEQNWPDPEESQ